MRKHLHRPVRKHLHGAVLGVTTALALAGCGSDTDAGAGDRPSADDAVTEAAPPAEATAAATWLSGQLKDGLLHSSYENPPGSGDWVTVPDYGLSLDALFALRSLDDHAADRAAILDAIEPQATAYVGEGRVAYAGSTGKLLAAVQAEGEDPADYATGDLVARLERLVTTRGDETGRAKDRWNPADKFGGDFSNTIGQSWAVRALTGADSEVADESVTFLLAQQCADGWFRLQMESEDHTCDGGTAEESKPSVDATAFAVQALTEVLKSDAPEVVALEADVEAALDEAGSWLIAEQNEDGSFVDADSGAANANSTGVAAEALLLLGEEVPADRAASWLADHQVTAPGTGELARHQGAVAFDDTALRAGEAKGITRAVRYQWQRATAQSVAALAGVAGDGESA